MSRFKLTSILFLFFTLVFLSIPTVLANCSDSSQNADLDGQCNTGTCGGTQDDVKGCYNPPDGSQCPAEYPNLTGDICCCK